MSHRELYSVLCGDLNGKGIKKRGDISILQLIRFGVQQKLTQHCKATILQLKKFLKKKQEKEIEGIQIGKIKS